ncbi:hypothetical protein C1645_814902 [Glomus cerebriforme]|uniref:Uncharacterized protein n=1 Tax=Glomus cerebriforme TaxID=658196 RepID=A0A397TPR7_9GLOM|nr:hypothetical protein C1645_814902 [Glomus cerebriforme]
MSNSKPFLHPIASKPQELIQNPGVIAVVTFPPPEIQEITVPTTNTLTTTKVSKKNNSQKVDSHEEKTGWDDANTGLLKNKSNFAKTAAAKIFPGKAWEQIKNKLARFLADGFSDDVQLFDNSKEKEEPKEEVLAEKKGESNSKKMKISFTGSIS